MEQTSSIDRVKVAFLAVHPARTLKGDGGLSGDAAIAADATF